MDDEKPTEVTAGAIVTVIVTLVRRSMSSLFGDDTIKDNHEITENGLETGESKENGGAGDAEAEAALKRPAWMKQKRGGGKKSKKTGNKQQQQQTKPNNPKQKVEESPTPTIEKKKQPPKDVDKHKDTEESGDESDMSEAETNDLNDKSSEDESAQKSNNEDDDQEWEKIKKLHDREKSLEGKSKTSHPVHCPYFPDDKQEYWWTYICDRKSRTLLTGTHYVTSLVEQETVHLKVGKRLERL